MLERLGHVLFFIGIGLGALVFIGSAIAGWAIGGGQGFMVFVFAGTILPLIPMGIGWGCLYILAGD